MNKINSDYDYIVYYPYTLEIMKNNESVKVGYNPTDLYIVADKLLKEYEDILKQPYGSTSLPSFRLLADEGPDPLGNPADTRFNSSVRSQLSRAESLEYLKMPPTGVTIFVEAYCDLADIMTTRKGKENRIKIVKV